MSDNTETQTLPKPGRPTNKQLDEREAQLAEREQELQAREANLDAEFEKLPPRVSIDETVIRKDGENPQAVRRQMHQGKWLADTRPYEEKYQDKKLMWVNDLKGDVQAWIDRGAEPVPVLNRSGRHFEGITDQAESKWVRSIGGETEGRHFWVYLLMVDPQIYDEVKIAPDRERQELIQRAMRLGGDRSGDGQNKGFQPYAPQLPSGKFGLEETRETVA